MAKKADLSKSPFLQRPGGNPTMGFVQPLGGLASIPKALPETYRNDPSEVTMRRPLIVDNLNRKVAQVLVDRGDYERPAVDPIQYDQSNIVKSDEPIGVAGYNQKNMVLPMKAQDMDAETFLRDTLRSGDPASAAAFNAITANPQQAFLGSQPNQVEE